MTADASKPNSRLLAVAGDPARGRALAAQLAGEMGSADPLVVATVAEALAALRHEPFAAVVALHEPPAIDALVLARALRGAGDETPLAILGHARSIDLEGAAWQAGADEYACLAETTAGQLAGRLRRAIDARERLRESRRLLVAEQHRLATGREEAHRLVAEQQRLVAELGGLPQRRDAPGTLRLAGSADAGAEYAEWLPEALLAQTPDGQRLSRLADNLADQGVTGPRLIELHLRALEEATANLAPQAEATVRRQADRLLLETVVHLAEAYRRRYVAAVGTARVTARAA